MLGTSLYSNGSECCLPVGSWKICVDKKKRLVCIDYTTRSVRWMHDMKPFYTNVDGLFGHIPFPMNDRSRRIRNDKIVYANLHEVNEVDDQPASTYDNGVPALV